jgi:hypothetical protein
MMLENRPRKLLENNTRAPRNLLFQKSAPSADGVPSVSGSLFNMVQNPTGSCKPKLGVPGRLWAVNLQLGMPVEHRGGEVFHEEMRKSQARGLARGLPPCLYPMKIY